MVNFNHEDFECIDGDTPRATLYYLCRTCSSDIGKEVWKCKAGLCSRGHDGTSR